VTGDILKRRGVHQLRVCARQSLPGKCEDSPDTLKSIKAGQINVFSGDGVINSWTQSGHVLPNWVAKYPICPLAHLSSSGYCRLLIRKRIIVG
jgi:hypothetical protein